MNFWEWLVFYKLIEGDPNYYASGQATAAEYAHAIDIAMGQTRPGSANRKALVDRLWASGYYMGNKAYWYTAAWTGQDRNDFMNASYQFATDPNAAGGGAYIENPPPPKEEPPPPKEEPPPPPGEEPPPPPGEEPPGGGGGANTGPTEPTSPEGLTVADVQAIYYWMPAGALAVFVDAYIAKGRDAAYAAIRQHPDYEVWFPGNMDDNGNIRYPEDQYAGVRESYRDVMRAVGIEPTAIAQLEDRFINLMEGEVSPTEFLYRVEQTYNRIVSASEQIKAYYADYYGIGGLSTEDLLFAAMDPEFGRLTLEEGFRIAEVGGAASESGFGIDAEFAELISDRGLNLAAAREMFGSAQHLVPILDILAQRHFDPDDDFDIYEFVQSEVFNDPTQNLRMRRLLARERSTFGRTGSFAKEGEAITGLSVA